MNGKLLQGAHFAILVATVAALIAGNSMATAFQLLHSFSGPEGQTPAAPLTRGSDGFVYGVAAHGGNFTVLPPDGAGTVFRLDAAGVLTPLHVFDGPEGAVPNSLIQGQDGDFYGTTTYGGQPGITPLNPGFGTIFRMDAVGTLTVLHVFGGGAEGKLPGPIVQGADGALYGHAVGGIQIQPGIYAGFVYRFDPITGDFDHLHDFVVSDGRTPTGPLFQGSDQSFYGTTSQGGQYNAGVVYKVDALGNFVLLHSLSPLWPGEGSEPKGGVIQASNGFFYGTTEQGGYGGGIFRMDAAGNFTVVHRFDEYASDGWQPASGLVEGGPGLLYGTAPIGGQPVDAPSRRGVVYRMDQLGTVAAMHTFTGVDGSTPQAALIQGADGQLYGSTVAGGEFGLGVLFRIDPALLTPPSEVFLKALMLYPTQASGGSRSTGTVILNAGAPPGGLVVALASSNPTVAGIPASLAVPQGAKMASFVITTNPVGASTSVNISAQSMGVTRTATLAVNPFVPADTIAIPFAQYQVKNKQLSIQATSTSTTATLKAYVTANRKLIGTLTNNGGGNYSGLLAWPNHPANVTVRSSLGGSASRAVTPP